MNYRHFGFFLKPKIAKNNAAGVRVTGAPPACIRSKQELWTRRSWRVLRHTTRPVSASIRHRQTSARALFFTPSLLTFSRSLPPCLPLSRASSVGEWNQLPKKQKQKKKKPQKKKPGNTDRQTDRRVGDCLFVCSFLFSRLPSSLLRE